MKVGYTSAVMITCGVCHQKMARTVHILTAGPFPSQGITLKILGEDNPFGIMHAPPNIQTKIDEHPSKNHGVSFACVHKDDIAWVLTRSNGYGSLALHLPWTGRFARLYTPSAMRFWKMGSIHSKSVAWSKILAAQSFADRQKLIET